jgi:signal transduction histidine kinase
LAWINSIGITLYALATVVFAINLNRRYKTAAMVSLLAVFSLFLNDPYNIRQRIYAFACSGKPAGYLDIITSAVNTVNTVILIIFTVLPYISIAAAYRRETFLYKKKELAYVVFVYACVDLWETVLIFGTGLKNYFFTYCNLLYYPYVRDIIAPDAIVIWNNLFTALFIAFFVIVAIPWKLFLKRYVKNSINNISDSLNESVFMMLHTYKNAFTAISMYAENNGLPQKLEKIKNISDKQLLNLTNTLDTLNAHTVKLKPPEPVDIIKCIDEALSDARTAENITLLKNYFCGSVFIYAGKDQIKECFVCILNNAAEAMKDTENPKISITADSLNNYVYIEIRDNGCGIKDKHAVFKPFYSTKMGGGNFGIGLAYTKKIIKALKGNIDIDCKKGKYTAIQLALPTVKN